MVKTQYKVNVKTVKIRGTTQSKSIGLVKRGTQPWGKPALGYRSKCRTFSTGRTVIRRRPSNGIAGMSRNNIDCFIGGTGGWITFGEKLKKHMKRLGVTNEYGLVGVITDVYKKNSELTTLRKLKDISVKVNESYGKLNYINNKFVINDISNYDKVYINDKVYTSGYGSINENLYIGKVIKVESDDISKKVYVESEVDFNNLNYVLIVGDFN